MAKKNEANLSEEIYKRISFRIILCVAFMFSTLVATLYYNYKSISNQITNESIQIEEDLSPYIISQALISNRYAIDIKIKQIEKKNGLKIKWYNNKRSFEDGIKFTSFLDWSYYANVKGIDGKSYGYYSISGSLGDNDQFISIIWLTLFIMLVFLASSIFILYPVATYIPREIIIKPLTELIEIMQERNPKKEISIDGPKEIQVLKNSIVSLIEKEKEYVEEEKIYKLTKQVAHDIRSPLAALNLLLSCTISLPEEKRILMRSSVQRITDIVNVLNSKSNVPNGVECKKNNKKSLMISPLMESLITEKRMQVGLSKKIAIDLNLDRSYGLFSVIDPTEFKRALSNLIDNSIESLSKKILNILVSIDHNVKNIIIKIKDNGVGIPENIIGRVGEYGFSYGKEKIKSIGNGLGVNHAIETISSFGGELKITSKFNCGTSVTITLPKSKPPKWFFETINLSKINLIVILDDDESIHELWKEKLQKKKVEYEFEIIHFKKTNDFKEYLGALFNKSSEKILFFIDYEFLGETINGVEIIKSSEIEKNSVLVTSHYDDPSVIEQSIFLGVKIIPKNAVSYMPIN